MSNIVSIRANASLNSLADIIVSNLSQADGARDQWIGAMTRVAVATATARSKHPTDMEFGKWWDKQDFSLHGKALNVHDRAALVQIGQDETAAIRLFETTDRRSLQYMVRTGELNEVRAALDLPPIEKRHSGRRAAPAAAAAQPQPAPQPEIEDAEIVSETAPQVIEAEVVEVAPVEVTPPTPLPTFKGKAPMYATDPERTLLVGKAVLDDGMSLSEAAKQFSVGSEQNVKLMVAAAYGVRLAAFL